MRAPHTHPITHSRNPPTHTPLHSSGGHAQGLSAVAEVASGGGKANVSFLALFLLGDVAGCLKLLLDTGRSARCR